MTKQVKSFTEIVDNSFEQLDLFTTAITRAHGKSHPEAFEVRELFETIDSEIKATGTNKVNLDEEFSQLRHITENYKVPSDVCETYASVYETLAELDQAYHAS